MRKFLRLKRLLLDEPVDFLESTLRGEEGRSRGKGAVIGPLE